MASYSANDTASFRPDETSGEIFSEHTWLQGAFITCIVYGIATVLYFMSAHLLWVQRRDARFNTFLLAYITVIFVLATAFIAAEMQFTQLSFIDGRNIEGGPNGFETVEYNLPVDMVANATLVILAWMCDVINIWRCSVIYRGSRFPWYGAIALPSLMYLATIALGICWLIQVGASSSSPWATSGINWTTPYFSMSLALNILVTILIVGRLLYCRARINRAMGRTHGSQYASLASLVVESAAIYSTFSLLFLVPFAINSVTSVRVSQIWLQPLSPVQVVSTLLIVFRVAQGKAWSLKTSQTVTDPSPAARTIGGTSIRTNGVRIDTNVTTHNDSKNVVALQTFGSVVEYKDHDRV